MGGVGTSGGCQARMTAPLSRGAHVRFGSEADIETPLANVRFTPESGHRSARSRCLLCAKSRHTQPCRRWRSADCGLRGMVELERCNLGRNRLVAAWSKASSACPNVSLELFRKNNAQQKHCWRSASL